MGSEKDISIVGEPVGKGMPTGCLATNRLRRGETSAVLLETFDTKQLFADRFAVVPGRGRRPIDDSTQEAEQVNLSASLRSDRASRLSGQSPPRAAADFGGLIATLAQFC